MAAQIPLTNQQLRVLALTSLYPNAWQPFAAAFNRQQLDALSGLCELSLVAPVFFTRLLGPKPGGEPQHSYAVHRPVYWYTPGFFRSWHGSCYLRSSWKSLRRAADQLKPQAVLTTWAYPDGWAALHAARRLKLPVVLKLHGSDINIQPGDPVRLPLIAKTLAGVDRVVAVSEALAQRAVEFGANPETIHIVPNGVDAGLFHPLDKAQCRGTLELPKDVPIVLFVGRLVDIKDPLTVLRAVAALDQAVLVVLGQGPLKDAIEQKAASLGMDRRLIMAGDQPLDQVPVYMAAADCLCLASRAEGSPNVVREALSCGLPVAASDVGDVRQVMAEPILGRVCAPGDAASFARAIAEILNQGALPEDVRAMANVPSWEKSAGQLLAILEAAASGR